MKRDIPAEDRLRIALDDLKASEHWRRIFETRHNQALNLIRRVAMITFNDSNEIVAACQEFLSDQENGIGLG